MRLNRVTLIVVTASGITGSGGASNDFSFTFDRVAPPYTAFTLVETVGPVSMAVGGTGVNADFDFSESSIAPKGNSMVLTLSGLDALVLPDPGPGSTAAVTIGGTAEWEAMDLV